MVEIVRKTLLLTIYMRSVVRRVQGMSENYVTLDKVDL